MDWILHGDGEVDGLVKRLTDDATAQLLASEDYALIELRATDAAAKAHAEGETCRAQAAWDADEIARLQQEQA